MVMEKILTPVSNRSCSHRQCFDVSTRIHYCAWGIPWNNSFNEYACYEFEISLTLEAMILSKDNFLQLEVEADHTFAS